MADQQITVVKKGEDPLTGDTTPKQDEPDGGAQQQAEEGSIGSTVLTTTSSAPRSIMNGLQLKLDGQDQPFASFTYALSPLTKKSVPVDWKLFVAEDVQSQHIRWHELQAGDDLPKLITDFQNAYAMAVVLINTSDNYSLHPSFLKRTQSSHSPMTRSFPVLMLTRSDGMTLMNKIEQYEENVFAKISAESFVDLPMRSPVKEGKGPAHSSPDYVPPKEQAPGVGQRIKQLFTSDKRPSVDLKGEIKKLVFPTGGDPVIVSESAGTFTMVMATFHQYEKQAKPESNHPEVNETLKKLNRHLAQTFSRDFPFYLLLAYKMHIKTALYQCDEMTVFMKSCCEKMESMEPNLMASTFLAFLQRRDFAVQFGSEESTSVFYLVQQACIQMAKISHHIRQREVNVANQPKQFLYRRFVYNRFMWVSLALKLHTERGIVTRSTVNMWRDHVIKYHDQLVMGPETVAEVKEGLEFSRLVKLPSDLTFSSLLLADLFVSEGRVRPFQHLRHYIKVVESYIALEMEFLTFITQIRAVYDSWLKQVGQTKLVSVSLSGTLADTLQEGLNFLNMLFDVWTQRKFDPQAFDPECVKWLLLLLQLVDITGDHPHTHFRQFILGKSAVIKKYQREIRKHVIEVTQTNFSRLTVQQFFPLYRAFHIWPSKFLEEYLREYKVHSGVRISDPTWKELFSEVVRRFSGAQHHYYLLDFLQSVAERYRGDRRAGELVLDLLQLKVPKLFAVEEGGKEDEEVCLQFSAFLRNYISRNALKLTILGQIRNILSVISEDRDEFQQLVLAVVQKEVIPEFKALQGAESVSNTALRPVLQGTVSTLCRDLSWLQALTTKQRFCWGIVASCCGKIPIAVDHFDWVHTYSFLIKQLGYMYNAYCTGKKLAQEQCMLSANTLPQEIVHSPSEDIRKYFEWVRHVQEVLLEWKQKFVEYRINYDEILIYASHQPQLDQLGRTVCASSTIIDTQDTQAMKNMLLNAFEQLNALLIKYIPGQPEAKWCTLPSLLADCGVALPPKLLDLMSRHVLFPGEENSKVADLLDNPLSPNTTGIFQPGHDISLKLTKALTIRDLSTLVQGLEAFLQPVMDVLDMLVFFKLHHSEMFDKYLHVHLRKESEPEARERRSVSSMSAFSFSVPVFPATSMQSRSEHESAVEGLPLRVLLRAMNSTRELIMKLMQGTATYFEIIAGGELNLEKLNIEREFAALHSFSAYLKLPLASYEGLTGVRSMLELFQYIHHIQTIHSVCEQYQLQGCLRDPQLQELLRLVEELSTEESRAKLTPLEASRKMERAKKILCLDSKARPCCLDLFTAVRDSAAFYQFVRDKRFVGHKGQAVFRQQYQLITAQLQHEEYDETVLNHLYAAFNFIGPFMDTRQDFHSLMLQVTRLDVTNGLKQLETVNTNITIIRLWFSRAEGDTLQNVAKELDRIITTGYYIFLTSDTSRSRGELRLEYSPSPSQQPQLPVSQPSSLEDPEVVPPQMREHPRILSRLESRNDHEVEVRNVEHWNSEQISDFVRKLGFLDTEKEGGDKIKHFLHVNETAYKLLELYVHLRELGHPECIHHVVTESLACAVDREEADRRVHETEVKLTSWLQRVTELCSKYDWLLFFNVPKLLILYHLLREKDLNLEAIVHEISFLCSNEQAALESAREAVMTSLEKCHKHIESDEAPMHVVGRFLGMLFNNHTLPKRCGEGFSRPRSVSRLSISTEPTQLLHYCPRYSQTQLIRLIVSIYDGVPEAFEVFHCRPSSTEEELGLFLKRAAKHPLQYLILEVNRLPFKLQELLMQQHLMIQQTVRQEKEAGTSSKAPCLHFVETAPSILREMPWVVLREHKESGPSVDFEGARKICMKRIAHPEDFACVQLVYGHAGDGKTHYIQQQLAHTPAHLTIAVNEAFTPLNAISKLRTLPLNQRNCAIFFNFTMLPPGESVDESERVRYRELMEVIGWFFFDLLVLGYVEDSNTGQSFRIPGSLAWAIYVEVPSRDHNMMPGEALKHFREEVPALGLLGTSHYINPETAYSVDEDVQLVCKYLKALQVGGLRGIDRLYQEVGAHAHQPVKFSTEPDLQEEECQQLLLQYMPEYIRHTKITQRLFIKYMKRRCGFLDTLPAFNYNTGGGEYIIDELGQRVRTNTKQLGSTLLNTMLKEVEDFCDPDIKENWSLKPHQQLIYDFKDGGASLGLISLHPDQLPDEDKRRFKNIGVKVPSMTDLYSRKLLDEHLSRALNVELENGHLTPVDDSAYVLTLDYTIKMLNIHERYECGVPVIIEGETGVGKTALVEMLSKLWNHALLVQWKRQRSRLLDFMRRKLGEISVEASDNYELCVQAVETLSTGQPVPEEELVLLGQLPDVTYGRFHSRLRSVLLPMQNDPVVTLLSLRESQHQSTSLEELFEKAEREGSVESTASLLHAVLSAQIKPTFYKLNVHAAMTPADIWNHFEPVFAQAKVLQEAFESRVKEAPTLRLPFVTVFLDEVNTSSCVGLFKEIIVDRTFDGEPIPGNVFIVAACNPHRGNSLASHSDKGMWVRGSYYVRRLHPTLRFLMWDYGSLDEHQERDYINAKMRMLNKQMPNAEVASLTDLIVTSQNLMRNYALQQLISGGLEPRQAQISSRSCVSQRDIQRVFTLYQWVMASYVKYKPYEERDDYSRRAVLVALGIVYYMRLNEKYRKDYEQFLDKEGRLPNEVSFSKAFGDELDWYTKQVELPTGIAKTQALKENLFATIVCTATHTPLIIVGAPGSSKTLSFNLCIANLKGQESKMKHFRDISVFPSLDPHFYQCSRRTTSNEIQTVFSRAINRQRSHTKFKLPIYCVVFMDEAGLPEESHESLKVLHYHLDRQEVSFVAITNHVLDAAKTNRAVSLFRPEASDKDLETLAKGCLCSTPENPPPELKKDLDMIVKFCPAYSHLMKKSEINQFFGLRDFIHFVNYLRRRRTQILTPQLVMEALERNFNGSDDFEKICKHFLSKIPSSMDQVQCRGILEVMKDSLEDRPQQRDMTEAEVRYKLIIDPSEDDSLVRLLFSFGVLQRAQTRMFVCSDFPGDSQVQKINTIAAIRHSAIEGHTVVMSQTDDIHESFYDLFNQRFRRIDDPQDGARYYTNIAIGAHLKPSRVHPNFQCIVVVKKSEVQDTPAPFLNRFEKYCITHRSLLKMALDTIPPCIKIVVETAMEKVKEFIDCISGPSSLFGLQQETLDSLVLMLLPPLTHKYESLGEPSVMDSGLDLKVLLMQELLQNLRHCAGIYIPPYSLDELRLDTDQLFFLVLSDPEFEGLLPNLSHTDAVQAVAEAMRVLHSAPSPEQEGAAPLGLSSEGCLVVALLQQWLVRHLCKQLMQLMTSEAFTLYRNKLPSSYLENYLSFHAHFSLQEVILKYHLALEHSELNHAMSPTKLLCFTRSSPLIHQLPAQYPSSVFEAQANGDVHQTLCNLVFPEPSQLVVCKLSGLLSQSSVQEVLRGFVRSNTAKVCLLVANMQDTSCQVVNHLRIMIEEAEQLSIRQAKLFVMLLHFTPAQFFNPCYPSLFLKGWDHCYLDTVAHSAVRGVVDIRDWFWQCCFPQQAPQPPEKDSLVLALKDILPEAIPVLSSHVFFGSSQEASFNRPMSGSQRSEALRELLFKKGVGRVLCERFRSYWKPAMMAEYLEKAANFTKRCESTLNITDFIQTKFKSLFFDFLVYLISRINEEFNIDILFDSDCTPAVQELFLDILRVFPLPKLSQIQAFSTNLPPPMPDHPPRFPFFKVVCAAVERIIEQSHEVTNKKLDLLQEEEEVEPTDSTSYYSQDSTAVLSTLQEVVGERITKIMEATPKEGLVLAVEAMGRHFDLWQRYFNDFLLHKLRLGGLRGEAISQQILHVFFGQLHEQSAMIRVVSLHCYIRIYHLNLAKMATVLRPLNQIQQIAKASPHLLSPGMRGTSQEFITAVRLTPHPLGTPEHLSSFVVNTLFNAIVGSIYGPDSSEVTVLEKTAIWFRAYRGVMSLPMLKQHVYVALEPQQSGGSGGGKEMEAVEARLNVMQAVFLAFQSSPSLERDVLLKGQQIFQTLFNRHFTAQLERRDQFPHLADVTSVAVEIISETSFSPSLHRDNHSVRLLMEGLFAHYFSSQRRGYHYEDVHWFLQLANEQEQWGANPLEHSVVAGSLSEDLLESAQHQLQKHHPPTTKTEVPQGAISMCVFKLYLGRILGSCDQHVDEVATLSGPLLLYHHQPRSQVGRVLMATPDLGPPAPYIPTYYQECSPIQPKANSENQRMQQPLAHLYFLTVLEHLQAEGHKLSALVRTANNISKLCTSPTVGEGESVILWVELQAVVQMVLHQLATHLDPSEPHRMGEIQPLAEDINRLLDDVETGGGDSRGHGMVLALHMMKLLKSSRKFTELLTTKYDSICRGLNCLQPFHEQLADPSEYKPHLFPFMLGGEGNVLGMLYQRVRKVMVGIHQGTEEVEGLVHIAEECIHSVRMRGGTAPPPPTESDTGSGAVDKRLCFRMMVWLCAYYDFYDKKVTSQLLCNVMGGQLSPYLREEGYIRLIQCFLNPQLMLCSPESPNPLREDLPVLELLPGGGHHTLERRGKKMDPIHALFVPSKQQQIDQSDVDLRHSLANLVGVVLGCPSRSNHLWYHLFEAEELHETYMTGFMYDAKINPDGLLYDCGVELSPEGQFGRQDYVKHATRGTYTLHSLYLLLWANFGSFCMALLTQPEATRNIHGPIISDWISVRHYCVSQLRTVWMHMRNNLGLSDEERSFLVMRCTKRLYELVFEPHDSVLPHTQLLSMNTIVPDTLRGVFRTRQELDGYEQMWHTCIYQPSWSELKAKFAQYSQFWLNKVFLDIRRLELRYPHYPSERDFTHSVLSSGDIRNQAQGGDLYLLARFAQEWPRLQAGGMLLPDLVEFYQWLHMALAHMVTYERATSLPIGRVVDLAVRRYSQEMGEYIRALYTRVKDGYNKYVELLGGAIGAGACAALRQGNKVYTIADDIPLLHFLSDVVEEEEGNDWLYTVVADIVAAHNAFIEGVYSSVQAQRQAPLARLLPDEPAKVYPSEVDSSNCIVGKFESLHGINDFLQLVRSRYQPLPRDTPTQPQRYMSISQTMLQTTKAPEFQLYLLQEDIVACFLAGKPLIRIEPSSLLRTLFKFRQSPGSITAAGSAADVVGSAQDLEDIAEKLPDTFRVPLQEALQKRMEYEFHSASYHTMVEVVLGLGIVTGHLIKTLMEQSNEGLGKQTVPQFMLTLYDHLDQSGEVLGEIGVRSPSPSQMACLVELPLSSLFCCMQLFAGWVRDGVYDFAALPFGVKTHMTYQDLQCVQQIPLKWTGSRGDLLEEIKQMNEVLKHSEAHITKTANEDAHKPIMQYLQEIHILGEEDLLPNYIPPSILIQHYVSFRMALRRLVLRVQQQVEAEEGDTQRDQWREFVGDLWDNRLPHLRSEVYGDGAFVFDPHTGRYGFQEGSEFDSEGELMDDLMNEPEEDYTQRTEDEESFLLLSEEQQPSLESSREEETKRAEHPWEHQEEDELQSLLRKDPEFQKKVLSMARSLHKDTVNLVRGARDYTPERVGQFLEGVGLGHHLDAFCDVEISGEMLLDATEEMLEELGVTSATERLKIKVLFRRSLQGGVVKYPLQTVMDFLKEHKLEKYCTLFQERGMDGDLLLEADDNVLKELGVKSPVDRIRIKTKYRTFVSS